MKVAEIRTPVFFILSFLLGIALPSAAYADGKAFGGKFPDFKTLHESEQVAAIAHHEGIQRMTIAVRIEMKREDNGLWVLPIPASATDVTVDLLDTFPRFDGEDPRDAIWNLNFGFLLLRMSQIWIAIPEALVVPTFLGVDPTVHATAEKWGLRSEVIETDSKSSLLDYIHSRDIELASRELDSFDPYFDGEHSFVATWIDSYEELQAEFPHIERSLVSGRWPSLFVTFPTEEIFYPMLASRQYEQDNRSRGFWVRLAILGHVLEGEDDKMRPYHHYKIQKKWPEGLPESFIEGLPTRDIPFTVIWESTFAEKITRDYRFAPFDPPGIERAILVWKITNWLRHPVSFVLFFAAWSVLCASFTGWTLFGDWKVMAWIGLWNFTTIVGLSFALMYHGLSNAERWKFLIRFSFVFAFGSLLIQFALIFLLNWVVGTVD